MESDMSNNVVEELPRTAFEDLLTARLIRIVGVDFTYNLHPDIVTPRLNGGSASIDDNRLKLSTGAGSNQSAQLFTNVPVKHYAGIGTLVRFTAIFTNGKAGSIQLSGIGDSGDGLFFGFNATLFGVLRRKGGNPEIRSIQITTKSTTAENITITLDGDADTGVTVTDATAGDVTTTVNDIVAHDFSGLGRGWVAVANGDTVNFISYSSEPRNGTYSLSGATTAVGAASQKLAGITPTDIWVSQTAWNGDRYLQSTDPENSPSGITLDKEKGNVFQIRFGWLGFDGIIFDIKNPVTKEWDMVHSVQYGNANITPFINNPTLPLCFLVENTSNTTDLVLYSSSAAGFVEGEIPKSVVKHVEVFNKTFSSTTIVPAITLHNQGTFKSKLNRVRARITHISIEVESGKPVVIEVIRDAILTGASFSSHDSNRSVVAVDTAATALTGDNIIDAFAVASARAVDEIVDEYIEPTKFITIAGGQASGGTNSVCKIIINWEEDF